MASELSVLSRHLARANAIAFALMFGVVSGIGVWVPTLVLVIKGGSRPGENLALLGHYFPGYSVTWAGAFIGFIWAFLSGVVLSAPVAWIYYRGVLKQIERHRFSASDPHSLMQHRASVPHFAGAFGLLGGFSLFLATLILLIKHQPGDPLGPHLGLLAWFFPGYEVSFAGAGIGFLYGLTSVGLLSGLVALFYNLLISRFPPRERDLVGGIDHGSQR